MGRGLGTCKPLSPDEVADELNGLPCRWWIAGGWAIDLHIGRQSRAHADIDVLILRDDHLAVQRHLAGWDFHAADPPGTLRHWAEGEILKPTVHDVWCRRSPSSSWSLQLMIDETENDQWVYRRDARIRRPVPDLDGPASNSVRRVLTPEIQLLYKSAQPRDKDEGDFHAVLEDLHAPQRRWLQESLTLVSPGHPWLERLQRLLPL
jgi:hypothetical protein